jgi:hypothetical protein
MVSPERLPDSLQDLQSLEHRIEREWWWINGALHAVAQLQAEGPHSLRELRAQARNVDRLRLAISVRLVELPHRFRQATFGKCVPATAITGAKPWRPHSGEAGAARRLPALQTSKLDLPALAD